MAGKQTGAKVDSDGNLEVLEQLESTESYSAWHARQHNRDLRLTRMSAELSASAFFRAGFRKDQPSLAGLDHRGIVRFIGWGEEEGQLYYLTEMPSGVSLSEQLSKGRNYSLDDVSDISWQMASALQHAHNQGIAHGHLTAQSVVLSEPLRIHIAGFGLYRWISESEERQVSRWTDLVRRDVRDLCQIMSQLLANTDGSDAERAEYQRAVLTEIAAGAKEADDLLTARDIQGKLGNLLLHVAGESIDMIDNRQGQGVSRRSIIDELFDDVSDSRNVRRQKKSGCLSVFAVCLLVVFIPWTLSAVQAVQTFSFSRLF